MDGQGPFQPHRGEEIAEGGEPMLEALKKLKTRRAVFELFEDYAARRKEELARRQLTGGLIKSYALETAPLIGDAKGFTLQDLGDDIGWDLHPLKDDLVRVDVRDADFLGFLEPVTRRHYLLHSISEVRNADRVVQHGVRQSINLDHVWLGGDFLYALWDIIVQAQMPERFTRLKFEHQAYFEDGRELVEPDKMEDIDIDDEIEGGGQELTGTSTVIFKRPARRIQAVLPFLRDKDAIFKALSRLRIPSAVGTGGYEFWDMGKVVNRGSTFSDFRSHVLSIIRLYEQITEAIESRIWVNLEITRIEGSKVARLCGAPVVLEFPEPLPQHKFHLFVEKTFERGHGPFRLWGDPIVINERQVHVYGVDLHLCRQLYLDLTPSRFVVIVPRGTCGNTVHRLITNVQRYLDPGVEAYIGDLKYQELIRRVLLGSEETDAN